MGLTHNFRNFTTVTSVKRVADVRHSVDSEWGEDVPCGCDHSAQSKWQVCGYEQRCEGGEWRRNDFCYRADRVVLATGTCDQPNYLHVPGEHLSYVSYSINDLDREIAQGGVTSASEPVVVVGAGLSAADAILLALHHKIPVVHVFRRDAHDTGHVLHKLPEAIYPEYGHVLRLMRGEASEDGYRAFPGHTISEFLRDNHLQLRPMKTTSNNNNNICDTVLKTSLALVLIGYRPDLSFLPKGSSLGFDADEPVDSKNNPLDVDPISYEHCEECGLYAMGPLVGDNFVRFLQGGALGIVADIWRKHKHGNSCTVK